VMMSKQLARIETEVPIELDLQALAMKVPDPVALGALYRELGFNSLLKELGNEAIAVTASDETKSAKKDYLQLANADEFREWLKKVPPKKSLAVWLNLDLAGRESEGFGTKVIEIEVSTAVGQGRSVWIDEQEGAVEALKPILEDSKRAKIVHDPKLFQLMMGTTERIEHATQIYSYLLRPTTSKHDFADVMFRQFNEPVGGGAGERADGLQRLAAVLRKEVEAQDLEDVYEKIDLPVAGVLAEMERAGVRVDPLVLEAMSKSMETEVRRLEKEIWKLAGAEFNVNSPAQLAEILFDKLNLEPAAKRGKGKSRSTAADVLEELGARHPLPGKVVEYREFTKLKSTYVDALPKLIHPQTGRLHTSFNQTGTATGRLS
jgi:DNA polymerase-1